MIDDVVDILILVEISVGGIELHSTVILSEEMEADVHPFFGLRRGSSSLRESSR